MGASPVDDKIDASVEGLLSKVDFYRSPAARFSSTTPTRATVAALNYPALRLACAAGD
ncbi:hypothetical protein Areg01_47420 [Actinoplanes regularis]|nr:hypothetical protein Areg01_47420 [Actinoplanes regularis]